MADWVVAGVALGGVLGLVGVLVLHMALLVVVSAARLLVRRVVHCRERQK